MVIFLVTVDTNVLHMYPLLLYLDSILTLYTAHFRRRIILSRYWIVQPDINGLSIARIPTPVSYLITLYRVMLFPITLGITECFVQMTLSYGLKLEIDSYIRKD